MNTYPRNNFDLIQNYIPYKIVKYRNDMKYYIMINIFVNDATIFGYSIMFPITEKFNKNYEGNEIYEFLSNIDITGEENIIGLLLNGTEELRPGEDYFITGNNDTTEFVSSYDNGNAIMSNNVSDYVDLSCIKIKDIENIRYFIYKNETLNDNIFNEDELNNLNTTFMNIIQENSELYNNVVLPFDFVYRNVIDYYGNGQYDDAIILMNSIFNTQLTVVSNVSSCGCNSQSDCTSATSTTNALNTGTDLVPVDTATCIDKYKAAIYQWLIQMLSDIGFYCNWMFSSLSDEDNITMPNEELLDKLIELLTEFLNADYDLSNIKGCKSSCGCGHTKKYFNNTNTGDCADLLNNGIGVNADNCSYYSIIENYIKVLNWVKNNEIDENKNKIYIYGKQFAEIFPLLNFN